MEPRLRPGAAVLADDLARVRSPAAASLSLPSGEDVEMSSRLG